MSRLLQRLRPVELPALWLALLLVHVTLGYINLTSDSNPFGDVTVVYFGWVDDAAQGRVPAVDADWVYPVLALLPMLLAAVVASLLDLAVGPGVADWLLFGAGWLVVVFAVTAALMSWLTMPGGNAAVTRVRRNAAWWLVAATAALGPIATGRVDAITLPIAVAGLMLLRHRPGLAGAALTIGAWVKVWPAAPFLAALIARSGRVQLLAGGAIVTGAIVAVVAGLGGWPEVASFVTEQTGRGLQVESPAATVPMLLAATGNPDYRAFYDTEILTVQVSGPGTAAISSVMTPVMAALVLAISILGVVARRAGASIARAVPPLALALVLALIITNKVGSPQFVVWVIAVVIAWLVWDPRRARTAALLTLAIALVTQVIYPWTYPHVMTPTMLGVSLLIVRNGLYLVLFVVAIGAIVRAWRDARGAGRPRDVATAG